MFLLGYLAIAFAMWWRARVSGPRRYDLAAIVSIVAGSTAPILFVDKAIASGAAMTALGIAFILIGVVGLRNQGATPHLVI